MPQRRGVQLNKTKEPPKLMKNAVIGDQTILSAMHAFLLRRTRVGDATHWQLALPQQGDGTTAMRRAPFLGA